MFQFTFYLMKVAFGKHNRLYSNGLRKSKKELVMLGLETTKVLLLGPFPIDSVVSAQKFWGYHTYLGNSELEPLSTCRLSLEILKS